MPNPINISNPATMLKTQNCDDWQTCANIIEKWKSESFKRGMRAGSLITSGIVFLALAFTGNL